MDDLALTRIAEDLRASLPGAALTELRQDGAVRFRLAFASDGATVVLAISLRPELPWIGRPPRAPARTRWSPDPFAVLAARELTGRVVRDVAKPPADRTLVLTFAGDGGLAIELVPRGANLVLLGAGGVVRGMARRSKGASTRLSEGASYEPRGSPPGRLDPFAAEASVVDRLLEDAARRGEPPLEALTRRVASLGKAAAAEVLREALASARTPGEVLRDRIDAILARQAGPVIEAPEDPGAAVSRGTFSPDAFRLLPWRPAEPRAGTALFGGEDAASTAGLYYACAEEAALLEARASALQALLATEAHRAETARAKARAGLAAFADPGRFQRQGEALLAGLAGARREGAVVLVPDPYASDGSELAIEAPPGRPLTQVADDLFRKHRRARRGLAAAAERIAALTARLERLHDLAGRPSRPTAAWAEEIEAEMRALGIPVGLAGPTRASRAAARLAKPSLPGVRIVESGDGFTILVGRTGRDNDRLTFKIAAPDDLWLHAQGVAGAHVIVRAGRGEGVVPKTTLLEAARLAAWFSDAREETQADVQWTRRKYVRRAKGGGSGTVLVKRSQTVRVRPEPPPGER